MKKILPLLWSYPSSNDLNHSLGNRSHATLHLNLNIDIVTFRGSRVSYLPKETMISVTVGSMTLAPIMPCLQPGMTPLSQSQNLAWLIAGNRVRPISLCIKRKSRDWGSILHALQPQGDGDWEASGHSRLKMSYHQQQLRCLKTWLMRPLDSSPGILKCNH